MSDKALAALEERSNIEYYAQQDVSSEMLAMGYDRKRNARHVDGEMKNWEQEWKVMEKQHVKGKGKAVA